MDKEKDQNWMARNWKWFVPAGCLSLILAFAGLAGAIVFLVFSVLKSSYVYEEALAQVKESAAVQQSIGTPIREGFLVSGNINTSGPSGNADLSIPIEGPGGEGTIFLVAEKSAGKWKFTTLFVQIHKDSSEIDLLQ